MTQEDGNEKRDWGIVAFYKRLQRPFKKKNHYLLLLNIMHQSIVFNNTKNNVH